MTDDQNTNQTPDFLAPAGPKNWSEHPNTITYFAQTNFRGEARKFGIKRNDRPRHMYVIGKTGMGKSTMLENMIIQDIQNGEGLAVVDPHGDLVEKVIDFVPENRLDDVIYFNPADMNFPIAFNIVEQVDDEYKNLIANGLVGVFKKIWADSWGPRLEYILINCILSLLDYPGATLLDVTRVLVDPGYRKKVIKKIKDPIVRQFWVNEYNNYSEKFRNEAIAPIQNKVGQFLSSSLIRNIVGQEHSTIDVRKEMDNGKILLMNLSKGRIGEENAALLGAMMITRIQLAAMSRVDIPESQRRDFYLYVDEFQNFSTESFASILSEARKYRLNITMAHQYIEQLSDEVKAAVFGNVGTMAAFRVGATDAEELEKEFQPTFMQEDIVKLPAYHIYMRLMIDGVASDPFSATTLPPISQPSHLKDEIIERSRARYASNKADVEYAINLWAAVDDEQARTVKEDREKQMARDEDAAEKESTAASAVDADLPPKRSKNGIPLPVAEVPVELPPVYVPSDDAVVPEEEVPQSLDFLSALMRDTSNGAVVPPVETEADSVAPSPITAAPKIVEEAQVTPEAPEPVIEQVLPPKPAMNSASPTVEEPQQPGRETRIGYPAPKPAGATKPIASQPTPAPVKKPLQPARPAGDLRTKPSAPAAQPGTVSESVPPTEGSAQDTTDKRKRKRKRKKRADGDLRTKPTAATPGAPAPAIHQPFKNAFADLVKPQPAQTAVQPQVATPKPEVQSDEPRVPVGLPPSQPPVQTKPQTKPLTPTVESPAVIAPQQPQPQLQARPSQPQPMMPGQPVTFD
jgi:hypothetical protein